MDRPTSGVWTAFPNGPVTNSKGGTATLQLSSTPIPVRHLRIWMTESSNTADPGPLPRTMRRIRVARWTCDP